MKDVFTKARDLSNNLKKMPGVESRIDPIKHDLINLENLIIDNELRKVVEGLFYDGHHARAVEEAFKFLNNSVKKKAELDPSIDGAKLMKQVFSANSPILSINSGVSQSEKDEQLGYMEMFSGCMTGIRNPRAHEHEWEDTEFHALQLIIIADHLIERVRNANKNP